MCYFIIGIEVRVAVVNARSSGSDTLRIFIDGVIGYPLVVKLCVVSGRGKFWQIGRCLKGMIYRDANLRFADISSLGVYQDYTPRATHTINGRGSTIF